VDDVIFSHNKADAESETSRMFGRVRQMAPLGAKSAVSDCMLFMVGVGKAQGGRSQKKSPDLIRKSTLCRTAHKLLEWVPPLVIILSTPLHHFYVISLCVVYNMLQC